MKLKKEMLTDDIIKNVFEKINCHIEGMKVFFPLDLSIVVTDEFGIETTKYKAESFYGNTYLPGLALDRDGSYQFCRLGYAPTTSLIAFNLAEFFTMTFQKLSKEEKDYISQFEVCLVKDTDCHMEISSIHLK